MADVVNQRTVHVSCNSAVQYGRNVSEMGYDRPTEEQAEAVSQIDYLADWWGKSLIRDSPLIFDNLRKNSVQAQGNCMSIVVVVSPPDEGPTPTVSL